MPRPRSRRVRASHGKRERYLANGKPGREAPESYAPELSVDGRPGDRHLLNRRARMVVLDGCSGVRRSPPRPPLPREGNAASTTARMRRSAKEVSPTADRRSPIAERTFDGRRPRHHLCAREVPPSTPPRPPEPRCKGNGDADRRQAPESARERLPRRRRAWALARLGHCVSAELSTLYVATSTR